MRGQVVGADATGDSVVVESHGGIVAVAGVGVLDDIAGPDSTTVEAVKVLYGRSALSPRWLSRR